jgi:hypothetical protein
MNDARALDATCSTPAHATAVKISLTPPPPSRIVASFPDAT